MTGQRLGCDVDEESDRRLAQGNAWERPRSPSVFTRLASGAGASVNAPTRVDPCPEHDVMAKPRGRGRRGKHKRPRGRYASPKGQVFHEGPRAWEEDPFRPLAGVRPGALLEDFLAIGARRLGVRRDLGILQCHLGSIGGTDLGANSFYQLVQRSLRETILRSTQETQTLADRISHLGSVDLALRGDKLVQRFHAAELSAAKSSWALSK